PVEKQLFHRHFPRSVSVDQPADGFMDHAQSLARACAGGRLDRSVLDRFHPIRLAFHDAKPGDGNAGIDADDAQSPKTPLRKGEHMYRVYYSRSERGARHFFAGRFRFGQKKTPARRGQTCSAPGRANSLNVDSTLLYSA